MIDQYIQIQGDTKRARYGNIEDNVREMSETPPT